MIFTCKGGELVADTVVLSGLVECEEDAAQEVDNVGVF